jgi:hypothetical protein
MVRMTLGVPKGTPPQRAEELLRGLLPRFYWLRDAHAGRDSLAALIAALAEGYQALEDEVAGIYDNLFIGTCSQELVPYLGAGLGLTGLATDPPQAADRGWVGQIAAFRRTKGGLATAARAAAAASGWSTYIEDGGAVTAHTQWLGDVQPRRGRTIDVGCRSELRELSDPWSASVRGVRISSRIPDRGAELVGRPARCGYPGPLTVELSVWRLRSVTVQRGTAGRPQPVPAGLDGSFTFDPAGLDRQLFQVPVDAEDRLRPPRSQELPLPLTRERLAHLLDAGEPPMLAIWRAARGAELERVSDHRLRAGDLGEWATPVDAAHDVDAIVDPERGRLLFPREQPEVVVVSYAYGSPGPIGAGPDAELTDAQLPAGAEAEIVTRAAQGDELHHPLRHLAGGTRTIMIEDSATYRPVDGAWQLRVGRHGTVRIMAAPDTAPVLAGDLRLELAAGARVELSGITVLGSVEVSGAGQLALEFVTLAPGPHTSLLCADGSAAAVSLSRSISGAIQAGPEVRVSATDCIVDGAGGFAIGLPGRPVGELDLRQTTVLGPACVVVAVAEQSILAGALTTAGPDTGVIVHSYVAPGSTPGPRIGCVPGPGADLRPRFASTRWGDPGYARLDLACPVEISSGEGAGGEMGAFAWLDQPARFARLTRVLHDMLPAGMAAGVTYRN